MNLNHLHLAVRNVERSRAFYSRYFGLRDKIWHGTVLFMTDATGFDLALDPDCKTSVLPDWYHHGFRLDTPRDVVAVFQKFKETSPQSIVEDLGETKDMVSFRCIDPDGFLIEVYWELQPSSDNSPG